jgi:hypothetical protein
MAHNVCVRRDVSTGHLLCDQSDKQLPLTTGKRGDRFAAYEPVAQAISYFFGSSATDAARGA